MTGFFQAGDCFIPYGNVRYIIDRGDTITVHLYSRSGPEEHLEVIIVEGDDLAPFRAWLVDSSDGPQQEGSRAIRGFEQGVNVVRLDAERKA